MSDHYSRIFLLSHMRAFTSLAGHILGSHPQINGYYEMHLSYDDESSLQKQIESYQENDTLKSGSRYFFDKLLHNDYALQLDRLNLTDPRMLLALREPESTIKSIVKLFAKKNSDDLYASPAQATRYYIERITRLSEFCAQVKQGYFYFDAEMLQTAPDVLLPRLSSWLELASPLSERYAIFSQTGKDRKGDTFDNIRSGKINKTQHDYSTISIPEDQLKMAQQAYRECRQKIMDGAAESVLLK
jgi:hypothetical protein